MTMKKQEGHLLDLDAILASHADSSSGSDDDGLKDRYAPRRTVDEILNDSSSDDDTPTLAHPAVYSPSTTAHSTTNDGDDDDRSQIENTREKYRYNISGNQSRFRVGSSSSLAEPKLVEGVESGSSVVAGDRKKSSLHTQQLFGGVGVRSAKPGAALAAATAASRPIQSRTRLAASPTPLSPPSLSTPTGSSTSDSNDLRRGEGLEPELHLDKDSSSELEVVSKPDGSSYVCFNEVVVPVVSGSSEEKIVNEQHDDNDILWETSESADTSSKKEMSSSFNDDFASLEKEPREAFNISNIFHESQPTSFVEPVTDSSLSPENNMLDESSVTKTQSPSVEERDDALIADKAKDEKNVMRMADSRISELDVDAEPFITTTTNEETVARSDLLELPKKAKKKINPLELAEEVEKKHAFSGLDLENDIASQPMRLEGVRRGSIALGYFDVNSNNNITRTVSSQLFRRDQGSPQSVAVHFNYVAVGLSKGLVLVVPSKYSPHSADSFDAKMMMLGLQGDNTHPAVTSMCFNQLGDLLFVGYSDGRITVWDLQKGSTLKIITGIHNAPVVHLLYLGQDSQVTRQYRVVSGDSKGLVWLITFSVVPWVNRISYSTTCLLDGQTTGKALCASPLLPDEFCGGSLMSSQSNGGSSNSSSSSISSMMGGVLGGGDSSKKLSNDKLSTVEDGVVIFATYQSALVARVSPSVVVYAQLSKPDGVREGSMPYTAWKSMGKLNGSSTAPKKTFVDIPVEASEKVSLLAIAWDRKVQVAKLVKSELKIFSKWTLESSAIGVAWMDDEMLVVLTSNGQLCLFAKDGTMIHQTSFIIDGYGGDDLVSYHIHFTNIYGNPEKAYHNCIAVRGATIYILGPNHLIICRLLPWKERVQVLRKACDWMGALNMAMSLFDGQAHGVIDLPRKIDDVQEAIMPYLVELLLSYVDEVFSYISVAFCNQIGKLEQLNDSESKASTVHLEIKEQFSRVGGVAVEFCVHIKRIDVLFDEILSKFVAVQQRDTFLELLEPYILKDMLGSLPPEVMQALVEHYSTKGWLQRVEQCVLHMDISSLDFNQVVRLCREHRLYGALVYLFNRGLDDFKAPLEELLIVLNDSEKEAAVALGYRMLVYLKYCFTGLAFPPVWSSPSRYEQYAADIYASVFAGQGLIPAARLPSLRIELMQFLLEPSNTIKTLRVVNKEIAFVNVYHLLELDTEATLDVLKCAFVENEAQTKDNNVEIENDSMGADQDLMVQKVVDSLVHVLDQTEISTETIEIWPSNSDIGHMLEFISYYIACKRAVVSNGILGQILEYYTSDINLPVSSSGESVDVSRKREKQILMLLEAVPYTDWETDNTLQLCVKAQFFQVCGLIHTIHHRHIQALDCYMKDLHEPLHAFCFITDMLDKLSDNEAELFRSAVISCIPDLIILSREHAFFMVMHHFSGEYQNILSELRSHPKSLFLYLKTVFEVHLSGTLAFSRLPRDENLDLNSGKAKYSVEVYLKTISGFSKYLRENPVQVTDEMIELYLKLLCQNDRNSVLNFLETFENYRVENCLRLCQEYGIIDASAFLLERVGDVGSALLLTLSGLDEKFTILDNAVEQVISDNSVKHYDAALKAEVNYIRDILVACVGLCQRNTLRLDIDESESLWFQLLDSFVEPLVGSFMGELNLERDSNNGSLLASVDAHKDKEAPIIKWKISKDRKNAKILRKLFSQFIREIVGGMIGFVRLPVIMKKLLADNSGQEFGDFKLTILEMLGTYGFERQILDTAKSLIEDDTFYTMSLLKKGASRGYAPKKLICCICNCLIVRDSSSSSGIHIFSCGHVSHLKCDVTENEMSHKGLGCPVCMPTKKGLKSKGKTAIKEIGLVVNPNSKRPQQAHGIVFPYAHESDAAEILYGFPQISRFDMLTSLKKEQRLIQVESIPQLRLAPPAVYHEKVKKRIHSDLGESSNRVAETEKPSKTKQLRDIKLRGSSIRLPLKANIFGKEKSRRG